MLTIMVIRGNRISNLNLNLSKTVFHVIFCYCPLERYEFISSHQLWVASKVDNVLLALVRQLVKKEKWSEFNPAVLCLNSTLFVKTYNILTVSPVEKTSPAKKKGVLGMILNCIWWWEFNSRALQNVMFPFIVIIPMSTLTWRGSTC